MIMLHIYLFFTTPLLSICFICFCPGCVRGYYDKYEFLIRQMAEHSSCMCVIIAITLINHHHHHSGHHHRHVLDEIKTHSQWQSVLLQYIFFLLQKEMKRTRWKKLKPTKNFCTTASQHLSCSPGFDKSC